MAAQLSGKVRLDIRRRRQDLTEYMRKGKPVDRNQQCDRNALRGELEDVVRTVRRNLMSLITASRELEGGLDAAEAGQLAKIDNMMCMLEKLRSETVEEFQKRKEEAVVMCEANKAASLSLEPSLRCLDGFMQQLALEVDDETSKAIQVHTEKLEQLQELQARYVLSNESPERNPGFAKVLEDIGTTERVLEEHRNHCASHKDLRRDWQEVLDQMPAQKESPPIPCKLTPCKRTLWDRVIGRS